MTQHDNVWAQENEMNVQVRRMPQPLDDAADNRAPNAQLVSALDEDRVDKEEAAAFQSRVTEDIDGNDNDNHLYIGYDEQMQQEADYSMLDLGSNRSRAESLWSNGSGGQKTRRLTAFSPDGNEFVREKILHSIRLTPAGSTAAVASPSMPLTLNSHTQPIPPATPPRPRFGLFGVYACLVLAQLCWSGFHCFAKYAFDYMHPLVLPFIRAALTAPVLGIICYTQDRKFYVVNRGDLLRLALIGFMVCVCCQNLFNVGLMLTTAADAGILQPAIPVFTACLAIMLKRERASIMKFVGILCAVIGTSCIVIGETYLIPDDDAAQQTDEDSSSPIVTGGDGSSPMSNADENHGITPSRRLGGILLFVISCFIFALYLLIQKPMLDRVPPMTVTFYTFLLGIPGTCCVSAYFLTQMEWRNLPLEWYGAMAYTVMFASIGGFILFAHATKHLPASTSSMGVTLQPFFSSLLGATLLGEILTSMHIVGGLFLIAGLAIVIISRQREVERIKKEAMEQTLRDGLTEAIKQGMDEAASIRTIHDDESAHGEQLATTDDVFPGIDHASKPSIANHHAGEDTADCDTHTEPFSPAVRAQKWERLPMHASPSPSPTAVTATGDIELIVTASSSASLRSPSNTT